MAGGKKRLTKCILQSRLSYQCLSLTASLASLPFSFIFTPKKRFNCSGSFISDHLDYYLGTVSSAFDGLYRKCRWYNVLLGCLFRQNIVDGLAVRSKARYRHYKSADSKQGYLSFNAKVYTVDITFTFQTARILCALLGGKLSSGPLPCRHIYPLR